MLNKPLFSSSAYKNQRGSALVYILIAIALLAALTVSFMQPSSQQTSSQNSFKSIAALQGQINTIRSAIQSCALKYPRGDKSAALTAEEPDANIRYPITPNSNYFPTAGNYRAPNRNVEYIKCPGNNDGSPEQHRALFGGASGQFMPPPPDLFEAWQYYNGSDGVYFWTRTTKSDAFLRTALEKLDDNFSECEADVIDSTSSATDLDDDAITSCPSGNLCFRVWMISNSPAGQHQDTAANCHL